MVDEIKFPLDFPECPNPTCGSTRRIADEVLQKEKDKDKAGPDIKAFLFRHNSIIMDASKTILSAPVIVTFYDACAECGMVRCIHAEVGTAMPGGKQPPPMTFGKS